MVLRRRRHHHQRGLPVAMIVALAWTVTGCSSDESSTTSVAPTAPSTVATSTATPGSLEPAADTTAVATSVADTNGSTSPSPTAATQPDATQPDDTGGSTSEPGYYVSLGDSYASGYEPGVGNNTNGFAYRIEAGSAAAGRPLELVNFGCAGATTDSLLNAGCAEIALGPEAEPYEGQTQIEAAEEFLVAHPGETELITVSIGGNDITGCIGQSDECIVDAVAEITTNLGETVDRLRAAAGPDALIVGTTYPDIVLGAWLLGDTGQALARQSIDSFRQLFNPALRQAYESVDGVFVDVTEATGGYGSLDEIVTLEPYGAIPEPVAQVCELTHFCEAQDIHANADGYQLIADLVLAQLESAD